MGGWKDVWVDELIAFVFFSLVFSINFGGLF